MPTPCLSNAIRKFQMSNTQPQVLMSLESAVSIHKPYTDDPNQKSVTSDGIPDIREACAESDALSLHFLYIDPSSPDPSEAPSYSSDVR